MHDTEQGNLGEYLRFLDPGYQSGSKHLRRRIADLDYMDLPISADYSTCEDHIEGKEKEFSTKGSTACASPLWTTSPRDIVYKESPLLPYYHDCSYLPSQRGLQADADARHALMELTEKMPDSSYELSFSVYVKEQQSMEESQEEPMEEKQDWKSKGEIEKKNNSRPKVLPRSDFHYSENLLLKVSPQVFLCSKKKPQGGCLNLTRVHLRKESEKPAKKEWWKTLCSEINEVSITDTESNSRGSSNSTNSSSRWLFAPGRGYFSGRKLNGCFFRVK